MPIRKFINNDNYLPSYNGDQSMTSSQHYLQISALNYEINNNNGSLPKDVRAWMQNRIAWYEQPPEDDGTQLDFNDFINREIRRSG